MSDREIIIGSLQRAQKQIHRNAMIVDLSFGLALFLAFPVVFKGADLLLSFRGRTVVAALLLWLTAFVIYIARRLRKPASLESTAASLDRRAALNDELKTAYWFVTDGGAVRHSPEWVALQVRRAAANATRLDIGRLYPRTIPVWSYASIGLIALWIGLNFAPVSGNHNWIEMKAAPAFSLTPTQQTLLNRTRKLLEKAKKLDNAAAAEKLEKFISDLEGGKVDPEQAVQQLKEMQDSLNQDKLDVGQINDGLDEIAQDLESSQEMSDIANELQNRDLSDAADKMQGLSDKIQNATPDQLKQMSQSLSQAGQESRSGLQNLAKDLSQAGEDLQNQNQQGMQGALSQAAKDVRDLQDKMDSQALKDAASQDLQNLQDSLKQQNGQQQAQNSGKARSGGSSSSGGQAQKGATGGTAQQGSDPAQQNPDAQNGDSSNGEKGSGDQAQDGTAQQKNGNAGNGKPQTGGLMTSGTPHAPLQLMGDPTKLSVQLEKEKVEAQAAPGGTPDVKDAASERERSTLDYRNVPSDLTPAQKDVLNQDSIPWEYRNLIKNYFQAIRPPRNP